MLDQFVSFTRYKVPVQIIESDRAILTLSYEFVASTDPDTDSDVYCAIWDFSFRWRLFQITNGVHESDNKVLLLSKKPKMLDILRYTYNAIKTQ